MDFYFEKFDLEAGKAYERAIVHVSIDPDNALVKFVVDLDSLPNFNQKDGKEVIVKFHVHHIHNNQTFYTDSNGLEMQERIINFRPTWNISSELENPEANQEISSNYYPITSAISIKDISSDLVLTVMNDRTQGGSSLEDGSIELM